MKSCVLKYGILVWPCHPENLTRCYNVKYHIPQNNNTEHFKGSFLSQNPNAVQLLTNLSSAFQRKLLALLEGFTGGSKIRTMSTKT